MLVHIYLNVYKCHFTLLTHKCLWTYTHTLISVYVHIG